MPDKPGSICSPGIATRTLFSAAGTSMDFEPVIQIRLTHRRRKGYMTALINIIRISPATACSTVRSSRGLGLTAWDPASQDCYLSALR